MGESDARFAAAELLDRRFFEHPHLSGRINAAGDYEVHCNECRTVDKYSFSRKNEVDAQAFALSDGIQSTGSGRLLPSHP